MTLNELKLCLFYDPLEGLFFSLPSHELVMLTDRGGRKGNHYHSVTLGGVTYYAHRLAWFYMTGEWPVNQIDHKDTVRKHNWWNNLREATQSQNSQNGSKRSTNTSGHVGVVFHKPTNLWRAIIRLNGRQIIRYSRSKEDAVEMRKQLAREHFGDFARE